MWERKKIQNLLSTTHSECRAVMRKKNANNQPLPASATAEANLPTDRPAIVDTIDKTANLENCFKVLAAIQDQIRFADTKAVFVFSINALMFGFVVGGVGSIKKALALDSVPASTWVALVALILFGMLRHILTVGMLIYAIMSRFGALAPRSRVICGHIATAYGKDYNKYVTEVKAMTEDDWLNEVGTQIVETSHIALTKHSIVRNAAITTIIGLAFWAIAVFSVSLIPGL